MSGAASGTCVLSDREEIHIAQQHREASEREEKAELVPDQADARKRREIKDADKNRAKETDRCEWNSDDATQKECTPSAVAGLETDDLSGMRQEVLGQAIAGRIQSGREDVYGMCIAKGGGE